MGLGELEFESLTLRSIAEKRPLAVLADTGMRISTKSRTKSRQCLLRAPTAFFEKVDLDIEWKRR